MGHPQCPRTLRVEGLPERLVLTARLSYYMYRGLRALRMLYAKILQTQTRERSTSTADNVCSRGFLQCVLE
jgi:hypothetical protein